MKIDRTLVKTTGAIAGLAAALLGGVWLLQGVGLLQLEPILCFADCEPVQGPSLSWAIIGLLALAGGVLGIYFSLRHGGKP